MDDKCLMFEAIDSLIFV